MGREISIGAQDFETLIINQYFYIDKTSFIKQWYESGDTVSLITRPRRFGKTLTMSMMNCFFSAKYHDRSDLFKRLKIADYDEMMSLQGQFPVIALSFANVKPKTYKLFLSAISAEIRSAYKNLKLDGCLDYILEEDRSYVNNIILKEEKNDMNEIIPLGEDTIIYSLNRLCNILYQVYGKKVFLFLDEYDTPLLEAYLNDYWDEASHFIRSLFNSTFKTNESLGRAIMIGITRIAKESIFSDLNNLAVYSVTSEQYADVFGFTEEEVVKALNEYTLAEHLDDVKNWYDGFSFGNCEGIYNPWSIINFLKIKKLDTYWANTSSGSLIDSLIRCGDRSLKTEFEDLIKGNTIEAELNEDLIFQDLTADSQAVWSLMLAAGYIKADQISYNHYQLRITNYEIMLALKSMVRRWFSRTKYEYNGFIRSLLADDIESMNQYMNSISKEIFSYFDTAKPESFYHGFVLGLVVNLQDRYAVHTNKESGYGRYDIMLEPLHKTDPAIIIEFKIFDSDRENELSDTVKRALKQIEEKQYDSLLSSKRIPADLIRKYGFAFKGKHVLIGKS